MLVFLSENKILRLACKLKKKLRIIFCYILWSSPIFFSLWPKGYFRRTWWKNWKYMLTSRLPLKNQ